MKVLVLGNGQSRLDYDKLIREWPGEVWGCNGVYRDYGPLLSRIATDSSEGVRELVKHRAETRLTYQVWTWGKLAEAGADKKFTSPGHRRSNSGSMLAMQALEEDYQPVLCGFDMGGLDVYGREPGDEPVDHGDKPSWIQKWKNIVRHYGPDAFEFIGRDWIPVLTGEEKEGGALMIVRFGNGYQTEMRDEMAKIYIAKGKVKQVKEKTEPKPSRPKKTDEPKRAQKQDNSEDK
jgi:hypothetical protein